MKQIIRAFALGLATATALLTFTYYQTQEPTESKALTDQEAIQHLEDKGYKVLSQNSEALKQEKTDEQTEKQTSQKMSKEKPLNKPEKKVEGKPYELTIEPGMLSSSISKELGQAGLIEDRAAFEVFLKDNSYSRSIQIGTYMLKPDMTFEEIAKKITEE